MTNIQETTPAPRIKFPLKGKLALMAIIVAALPLLVVGWLVVDVNKDALLTSLLALQRSIVGEIESTLEAELHRSEDALASVGHALSDESLSAELRLQMALKFVSGETELLSVAVYGEKGQLIDTLREVGQEKTMHPRTLEPVQIKTARDDGIFRGTPMKIDGTPFMYVVQPISSGKSVTGFVGSHVSLRPLVEQVRKLSDDYFPGNPDGIYVVDKEKRFLAHPLYDDRPDFTSASGQPALVGFQGAALGKSLVVNSQVIDESGRKYVATVISDPNLGWTTVAQTPEDIAFASLAELRRVVFGLTLLAILFAIIVAIIVSSRMTKPLERLLDLARRMANRDFEQPVVLATGDEVGVLAHAMNTASHDLRESEKTIAREAAIRQDLGRYVPHELVDRIVTREQNMNLGGERREMTIVFADVVEFTPLTEKLAPDDVVALLNELFTILTEIIFRHKGMVDKFVGDSVMAIFGAPDPMENHADHAVEAAQEMMRWLEIGNARWAKERGVTIRLAIGIHSGDAVIGNVGSEQRMEYTAIGETVNVAARLEAIARPKQILLSKVTRDMLKDPPALLDAGSHVLAGVSDPVEVFSVGN